MSKNWTDTNQKKISFVRSKTIQDFLKKFILYRRRLFNVIEQKDVQNSIKVQAQYWLFQKVLKMALKIQK